MKTFNFTINTIRGKRMDFSVRPRIQNGEMILPSVRFKLADVKNVIVRRDEIFVDLVNSAPDDPDKIRADVKAFVSGWSTDDYGDEI